MAEIDDNSLWAPPTPMPPPITFVLVTLEEHGSRWVEPAWVIENEWCDMYNEPLDLPVVAWCKFPDAYTGEPFDVIKKEESVEQ